MTGLDAKADLYGYLQAAREALLWKLDGLSEYHIRRPMVPTGTNLLGLIKHVASIELGYFGHTFGRPRHASSGWGNAPLLSPGARHRAVRCAQARLGGSFVRGVLKRGDAVIGAVGVSGGDGKQDQTVAEAAASAL